MAKERKLTPAQQQFGNKNAQGCLTSGRKRSVSLPPSDMIALGEEMVDWVLANDPIHLSQWYCIHKGFTDKQWDAMQQMPEFLPYYQKAIKLVGYKYITKDSPIEPSLKQRWQRVYFKDLVKQEDIDAKEKSERDANALMAQSKATAAATHEITQSIKRNRKEIK